MKVGDRVIITNRGRHYPVYETMAKILKLSNWKAHSFAYDTDLTKAFGTIVGMITNENYNIIGVKLDNDIHEIIIGTDGVKVVEIIPEDLFLL